MKYCKPLLIQLKLNSAYGAYCGNGTSPGNFCYTFGNFGTSSSCIGGGTPNNNCQTGTNAYGACSGGGLVGTPPDICTTGTSRVS
jgi:hypothetical protein